MKTAKASYALFIAVGLLMTGLLNTVMATTYYWDSSTSTGYQSGTGTWDSSDFWTLNGTALTTWPVGTTHDAVFSTVGQTSTNLVSLTSPITVNSLTLGNGNSQSLTIITNGTLTIGAGGISVANNNVTAQIWSEIVLGALQPWSLNFHLGVRGNISGSGGITRTGNSTSTLSLYGTNNFSGISSKARVLSQSIRPRVCRWVPVR